MSGKIKKTPLEAEREIVIATINTFLAAGFSLSLHDGEDFVENHTTNANDVYNAMWSVGIETLYVHDDTKPGAIGQINFVHGNDGYDVINDYSTALEPWYQPIRDVEDRLEEEMTE